MRGAESHIKADQPTNQQLIAQKLLKPQDQLPIQTVILNKPNITEGEIKTSHDKNKGPLIQLQRRTERAWD